MEKPGFKSVTVAQVTEFLTQTETDTEETVLVMAIADPLTGVVQFFPVEQLIDEDEGVIVLLSKNGPAKSISPDGHSNLN